MAPTQTLPVEITYHSPGTIPPVFVAGSFTDPAWDPIELEHAPVEGEVKFSKKFDVKPGTYQYKYRLGHGDWWICDDSNRTETDGSGNLNNILVVEKPEFVSSPVVSAPVVADEAEAPLQRDVDTTEAPAPKLTEDDKEAPPQESIEPVNVPVQEPVSKPALEEPETQIPASELPAVTESLVPETAKEPVQPETAVPAEIAAPAEIEVPAETVTLAETAAPAETVTPAETVVSPKSEATDLDTNSSIKSEEPVSPIESSLTTPEAHQDDIAATNGSAHVKSLAEPPQVNGKINGEVNDQKKPTNGSTIIDPKVDSSKSSQSSVSAGKSAKPTLEKRGFWLTSLCRNVIGLLGGRRKVFAAVLTVVMIPLIAWTMRT